MGEKTDFERDDRPSTAQPAPVHVEGAPSVHDLVIADLPRAVEQGDITAEGAEKLRALLLERKEFGLAKYGTVLQVEDPARDARMDLLEEVAGDGLVYAFRVKAKGYTGGDHVYQGILKFAGALADIWYEPNTPA